MLPTYCYSLGGASIMLPPPCVKPCGRFSHCLQGGLYCV